MDCVTARRDAMRAARVKQRAADGAAVLPGHYRPVLIKQETGARGVWDFDFLSHNWTRFAGLENGIANCYTNPLWQVLYFIPSLRCVRSGIFPTFLSI